MNIFLASDLHLDTQGKEFIDVPTGADIVVLAGDIHRMINSLEICSQTAERIGKPVVFVPGNHEFHYSVFNKECDRALEYEDHNVHVLLNRSVTIGNVKFIGSVLWTNFLADGEAWQTHAMVEANDLLSDFKKIRYIETTNDSTFERNLTPKDVLRFCIEAQDYIRNELNKTHAGPKVVVTHFCPSPLLENKRFSGSNLSPYFNAVCDGIIEDYSPDLWLYAHTHASRDSIIGKTRVCSNQVGTQEDFDDPGFRADWLIEVGGEA